MYGTLKMAKFEGISAKTPEEVLKLLYDNGDYHFAIIHHYNHDTLENVIMEVTEEVRKRNKDIPEVKDQMVVGLHYFEDLDNCLHAYCAEIRLWKLSDTGNLNFGFTLDFSVLTDPSARQPLSDKALATLAMMGNMITGNE